MDFSGLNNSELIDLAESAARTYDGLRIYGQGALSDLVPAAKQVWDAVRAEIEARDLGHVIGL